MIKGLNNKKIGTQLILRGKKYSWNVIFVASPGERPANTEKLKKEMFTAQLYTKTDA